MGIFIFLIAMSIGASYSIGDARADYLATKTIQDEEKEEMKRDVDCDNAFAVLRARYGKTFDMPKSCEGVDSKECQLVEDLSCDY